MSRNWLVSGLSVVDSGLQLYWGVRKMVCSDEEEDKRQTSEGQGHQSSVGWSQKQEFGKSHCSNGHNSAQYSSTTQKSWKTSGSKRGSLPEISEGQEMGSLGWSRPKENAYKLKLS